MEEGREAGKSMTKREKSTGPRTVLAEHLDGLKSNNFRILINHASAPIRKERLNPTSKARRRPAEMSLWFMEEGGMPDRVKSFREINSREDRPRAPPGFVKPIRNRLRKIKNLI